MLRLKKNTLNLFVENEVEEYDEQEIFDFSDYDFSEYDDWYYDIPIWQKKGFESWEEYDEYLLDLQNYEREFYYRRRSR